MSKPRITPRGYTVHEVYDHPRFVRWWWQGDTTAFVQHPDEVRGLIPLRCRSSVDVLNHIDLGNFAAATLYFTEATTA